MRSFMYTMCSKKAPYQPITVNTLGRLLPIPVSSPWEVVAADCLVLLATSLSGEKYIFVIGDMLTKYVEAVGLPTKGTSVLAQAYLDMIVIRHGPPRIFINDRGINFTSKLMKEVLHISTRNGIV